MAGRAEEMVSTSRVDFDRSAWRAPIFRVLCHFLGLHGRGDEAFPAVGDILAIGCLLALFSKRLPKISGMGAGPRLIPVLLVAVYMSVMRFHTTVILLLVLWPLMHFSIAGLLLHVVQRPYRILNAGPVVWVGKLSYGLYLWQQVFSFGERPRPWYSPLFAVGVAAASYYVGEQPMMRLRERRASRRREAVMAAAA